MNSERRSSSEDLKFQEETEAKLTVEVDSSRSVRVDFGDHLVQLVLCDRIVQSSQNVAQVCHVYVTIPLKRTLLMH